MTLMEDIEADMDYPEVKTDKQLKRELKMERRQLRRDRHPHCYAVVDYSGKVVIGSCKGVFLVLYFLAKCAAGG